MNKKKFYAALIIFSLVGQIAWVVENMYFNVFIYKMFNASASDISLMVGASAAAALRKIYTDEVIPLAEKGLCGSVLTQISDVEDETNGLITFDRRVVKVTENELADIGEMLNKAVNGKSDG